MKHAMAAGALLLSVGAVPAAQAEPFDWTGFYVGAHAGYATGDEEDGQADLFSCGSGGGGPGGCTATTSSVSVVISTSITGGSPAQPLDPYSPQGLSGFIGGVHAGYNVQFGRFVFGVEGDLDASNIEARNHNTYDSYADRNLGLDVGWQASLRLRAGYALTDHLLLYATGGAAIADAEVTTFASGALALTDTTTESKTHSGWIAGLGADYAFTEHWVGRVELRYTDFGAETYQTQDGPLEVDWTQESALIGISYKF